MQEESYIHELQVGSNVNLHQSDLPILCLVTQLYQEDCSTGAPSATAAKPGSDLS
jgi:hypothetical protein